MHQSLMDSFDDSTHAGSARPDATDVGDFVIGFLATPDIGLLQHRLKTVLGDLFYRRLVALETLALVAQLDRAMDF